MSREIVERLAVWFHRSGHCDWDYGSDYLGKCKCESQARNLLPEIERLLADEREKVREMCCKVMCVRCAEGNKPFGSGTTWQHSLYAFREKREWKETWFENCEAAPVRQLDLTAPSSTEEGKG